MKTNELQLVSYEQARKIKKLGFDWKCDHLYNGELLVRADCFFDRKDPDISFHSNWNDEGYDWNDGVEKEWTSAPTVQLALKWFRDVKNQYRDIRHFYSDVNNKLILYFENGLSPQKAFDTYEQAESALLDELLKIK